MKLQKVPWRHLSEDCGAISQCNSLLDVQGITCHCQEHRQGVSDAIGNLTRLKDLSLCLRAWLDPRSAGVIGPLLESLAGLESLSLNVGGRSNSDEEIDLYSHIRQLTDLTMLECISMKPLHANRSLN